MASRSRTVVEPTSWGGASGTGVPVAEGLKAFKLNNGAVEVIVLTYGATLVSCKVPSSRGPAEEVTLCYDSLEQLRSKSPYYGSTVGRGEHESALPSPCVRTMDGGRTPILARHGSFPGVCDTRGRRKLLGADVLHV
jgi:hypothetical protein